MNGSVHRLATTHRRALFCFLTATFLALAITRPVSAANWEIDATGTVYKVIDGDTFDASPVGRVRLADIDAPEVGHPGYQEAKDFLNSWVFNETVYLDVDDVYGTDPYDRLVCVVYVRYNATHLMNVNKALLDAGLADISDFPNEFNPATWTLYVPIPTGGSPRPANDAVVFVGIGAVAGTVTGAGLVYAFLRRRSDRKPGN